MHNNASFRLAIYHGYTSLIEKFREEVYKIDYSSWTEEETYRGTLLAAACEWSDPNLHGIKILVETVGVDLNAVSSHHRDSSYGCHSEKTTALHVLAKGSHFWQIEALKYLLKQDTDLSAPNSRGQTPLLAAVSTDQHDGFWKEQTIGVFLEHGSDPNIADNQGVTCLEHTDNSEVAHLLFQYGADLLGSPNALSCAVERVSPLLVEVLLENGADACKMASDKYILHDAARGELRRDIKKTFWKERQLSIIRLLLSHGASPFFNYGDGTTVLQAVIEEHGIVSPFFELEALDVERRGRDERTMLISACIPCSTRPLSPGLYLQNITKAQPYPARVFEKPCWGVLKPFLHV